MSIERLIAEMMADTPRALFALGEASGNPQDQSGNALHFSSSAGSPTYREGWPYGGHTGIRMDSTDQLSRANVSGNGTNYSCEMWIMINSTTNTQLLLNGTNANGGGGMRVDLQGSGNKLAFVYPFVVDLGQTAATLSTGRWYHAVFTKGNAGSATLYYINGELDSTKGTSDPQAPTTNFRIPNGSGGDVTYGPVAWYHSQLSAARIRAHYAAGTWLAQQQVGP